MSTNTSNKTKVIPKWLDAEQFCWIGIDDNEGNILEYLAGSVLSVDEKTQHVKVLYADEYAKGPSNVRIDQVLQRDLEPEYVTNLIKLGVLNDAEI